VYRVLVETSREETTRKNWEEMG